MKIKPFVFAISLIATAAGAQPASPAATRFDGAWIRVEARVCNFTFERQGSH